MNKSSGENISLPAIEMETHEFPENEFQQAFTFSCSFFMFIFCLIGLFGNIMSALIFTRRSMHSSINVLLTGLSFVDLSVLILAIPVFVVSGLNSYGHMGYMSNLQLAIVFVLYPMAAIAQTSSIWTFVLITFERYLAVCYPLRVRFFSIQRAKYGQLMVIGLSILYNLSRFWEYKIIYDEQTGAKKGFERDLRKNQTYFLGYYTVSYLCFHFLIPFTLIASLNARIVNTITTANKFRLKLTLIPNLTTKRQCQITRMIIVVTVIFALSNTLPIVLNIWEAVEPSSFYFRENSDEWHSFLAYLVSEISNVLVVLNSSINFLIYLIFCKKYRRIFAIYYGWFDFLKKEKINQTKRYSTELVETRKLDHYRYSVPRTSATTFRFFRRFTNMSNSSSKNSF